MNKHASLILVVLALTALVVAACSPAASAPPTPAAATSAAAPTTVPAAVEATQTPEAAASATPDTRPVVPAPDGSRALANLTAAERTERFSGPAANVAQPNTIYVATIFTDKGNIVAELYQDTPEGVNNFVGLALNGFYDGLTFHRVADLSSLGDGTARIIQGGDPAGDGGGGPGYTIPAEIGHPHIEGALAWARTSDEVNPERASSGSQFYIALDDTYFLDGAYSVFGNVIEGLDVAEQIVQGDKIVRIDISTGATSLLPTPGPTRTLEPTPTPGPTDTPTVTPTPYAPSAEKGRPLAQLSLEKRDKIYNTAPAMTIDAARTYQATIETAKGKIVVDLDAKAAPITVNNFATLANLGYYDGMPVAYNDPTSYLVSGSPAKEPDSDVGYTLALETAAIASDIVTGTLSMWAVADMTTGEPVASGSQFLIWQIIVPDNPGYFNSFGKVVEGMDVIGNLTDTDLITTITITEK